MQEDPGLTLGHEDLLGKVMPTHALCGEFRGQRSLVGESPWSRKESDVTVRLTLSSIK